MRTKLVLPLVTLAMLATALPASAQGLIDAEAATLLDEPVLPDVGDLTYVVCPNQDAGPVPIPSDVRIVERAMPTPPEVRTGDSQPRGTRHL